MLDVEGADWRTLGVLLWRTLDDVPRVLGVRLRKPELLLLLLRKLELLLPPLRKLELPLPPLRKLELPLRLPPNEPDELVVTPAPLLPLSMLRVLGRPSLRRVPRLPP